MVFTKLMRPLLAKWRMANGISIAVHLDDGLIWAESAHREEKCVESSGHCYRKELQLGTASMYTWALNQAERDEIIDNHDKMSSSINLPQELSGSSSSARELFDILSGLQAFLGYRFSEEVVWHCDSQAAIAILKKGGREPELQPLAQHIWKLSDNLHVKIEFVWISQEFNTEADEASNEIDLDD
ncbi:hypothetical protein RB195_025285 [Necator americanus]|uniref:RNase H type-1 domain-containing protein n=1 Tax=Necator americanus TaxID=51031 RepID=A0ABR1ERP7_NECAM